MAVRNGATDFVSRGVAKTTWTGLLNGDTGSPMALPAFSDKTFQIFGTFGAGGTISLEGSNDNGTTWFILNDSRGEGNPITITTGDGRTILENPFMIQPHVTAGDGTTALTCVVISHGSV